MILVRRSHRADMNNMCLVRSLNHTVLVLVRTTNTDGIAGAAPAGKETKSVNRRKKDVDLADTYHGTLHLIFRPIAFVLVVQTESQQVSVAGSQPPIHSTGASLTFCHRTKEWIQRESVQ